MMTEIQYLKINFLESNPDLEFPDLFSVESSNEDVYSWGVKLFQELLVQIYEEYKRWCEAIGKEPICVCNVKKRAET